MPVGRRNELSTAVGDQSMMPKSVKAARFQVDST